MAAESTASNTKIQCTTDGNLLTVSWHLRSGGSQKCRNAQLINRNPNTERHFRVFMCHNACLHLSSTGLMSLRWNCTSQSVYFVDVVRAAWVLLTQHVTCLKHIEKCPRAEFHLLRSQLFAWHWTLARSRTLMHRLIAMAFVVYRSEFVLLLRFTNLVNISQSIEMTANFQNSYFRM